MTTYAKRFAVDLMRHHANDIVADEQTRNAVILKTVALLVLAYDVPATTGGQVDYEEAIEKLRAALTILKERLQ